MIVVDTSVVVAALDARDDDHEACRDFLAGATEELVTTPLAVAEMDHVLTARGGPAAAEALRAELTDGAYAVEWWSNAMREILEIAERHASLPLGLTDASLVALAGWLGTVRIATLDERHFRVIPPLTGESAFMLLPADAG